MVLNFGGITIKEKCFMRTKIQIHSFYKDENQLF